MALEAATEARQLAAERADRAHRQPMIPPALPATPPTATTPPKAKAKPAQQKATTPTGDTSTRSTAPGTTPARKKSTSTPKPGSTVKPPSGAAGTVVSYALAQVGKRYVYGASGPNSFDCSGLVQASYARVGVKLPHQSGAIASRGRRVPAGQWKPGDVIHTPGHVAIYLGNNKMVAATKPSTGVRVDTVRGGTAYRFL
ncbi:cell wall-associated NlpC family hydrolase [Micromonospora pisi]|uniref:Cell wall-associated NlpC family hydrolase n=1 Tax=Micromonospora pisi TaxID=589240 RepID=A0A495JTK7_9ACTN|nr:C40 family peptidase [Micromonospora pisi]RKR92340.1 cell wall-associated NlpC family hydrolase [Micromonospora pisi]